MQPDTLKEVLLRMYEVQYSLTQTRFRELFGDASPHLFFQKIKKMFADKKISSIFAAELTMPTSSSALHEAAFFVSARKSDSIGCCIPSGSRFIALLTLAIVREQQSFFINVIFNQTNANVS